MRKILSIVVVFMLTLGAVAQTQHLKFMGIPLTGTISAFHQKLVAKGVKHDVEGSKGAGAGSRYFDGIFYGENARIYVNYNPATKIVYRAKAVITYYSEDSMKSGYAELKSALSDKYPNACATEGEYEGYDAIGYFVNGGCIELFCSKNYDTYPTEYWLFIDYWDAINSEKNEHQKSNDL